MREPYQEQRADQPVLERLVDDVPSFVERRAPRGGVDHGSLRQSMENHSSAAGEKADAREEDVVPMVSRKG
jgi:hypothetical protein